MEIPQQCWCDTEDIKKSLTIIIHMKKMDSSSNVGSGTSPSAFLRQHSLTNSNSILSNDTNNNSSKNALDNSNSSGNDSKSNSKSESSTISCGKKAFYKLIFNKSSGSNNNDSNNNNNNTNNSSSNNSQPSATPPLNNSYTKVSMERAAVGSGSSIESKLSQMSIDQNRQSTISSQSHHYHNQGNSLVVSPTSIDLARRYNSSLDEYRLEDTDERARIQRAIEIQEGIEIDQVTSPDLIESLTSLNSSRTSGEEQQQQDLCKGCQQSQMQYRGIVQHQIADDENNPRYHSQVAYCHYLVPDLEKITACCYYWGKMDRYEAEKLLEGKPEGTFLLRDSAQDDYLFSVSFRKYGRSLHARIEQFNHKFSFDSHDPSVFMASTVTGLVEHYKDPTSVMFFEPMLTSPLHRNYVFSLQQLSRAAIVSHTSYDGINKLSLPIAMKNYLKEYHYKLRVRVKQFPEGVTYQSS